MKRIYFLPSCLLLITVLFSCSPSNIGSGNTASLSLPNSFGDIDDKSKWVTPVSIDTHYVKLEDMNTSDISEIRLDANIDPFNSIVIQTSDGFLYGSTAVQVFEKDVSKQQTRPQIRKFDDAGKTLWTINYDFKTQTGRLNNLLALPDGGFIFSIQTSQYYVSNQRFFEKPVIVRCNNQGIVIWSREFEDYNGDLLRNLFITKHGDILAIGQWNANSGKQSMDSGSTDIVITKLNSKGNILLQKSYGGKDFDCLNSVVYDGKLGIVIQGNTLSTDGHFAGDTGTFNHDFTACLDEGLNLKWVLHAQGKESFKYDDFIVSDGYVYIPGNYRKVGEEPLKGFIIKIDSTGNRVWTKPSTCSGMWSHSLAVLDCGNIVTGSGQQNQGILAAMNQLGNEIKKIEDLKFSPGKIIPTKDGGFITTSCREIKPVPQPPYVSCIWYDTELVISKYSSRYGLQWRKTYDNYKGERTSDFAMPLTNGQIVICTP